MYKLIIIDDEKMIRNGLKNTINWKKLQIDIVYTACDGEEGFEIICQNNPDIIITDIRMPSLDGLELLKALKTNNCSYKVIIISGFSDFKYAQKALQFGAIDYILKPIDEDVLISQVKKSINQLNLENAKNEHWRQLENKAFQNEILSNQLALDFIIGNSKYSFATDNIFNDFFINYPYFLVGVLNMSYDMNEQPLHSKKDSLDNIYNIYSKNLSQENILVIKNNPNELIFIFGFKSNNNNKQEAIDFLQVLLDNIYFEYGFYGVIGISNIYNRIKKLSLCYQEAINAYGYKLIDHTSNIFDIDFIINNSVDIKFNTNLKNELWLNFLKEDKHSINQLLLEIIHTHIISKHKDITILKVFMISILDYILNKYNNSLLFSVYTQSKKDKIIEDLEECKTPIDVYYISRDFLFNIIDSNKNNINSQKLLNEIIYYVTQHYNENISMNTIAKKFYLSPSYFSKIFSEHVGEPFSKYLTKLRLEEAKKLLNKQHLKIYQISKMVGYTDCRYFIKVFKNYESLTPVQYREQMI